VNIAGGFDAMQDQHCFGALVMALFIVEHKSAAFFLCSCGMANVFFIDYLSRWEKLFPSDLKDVKPRKLLNLTK